MYRMCDVRRSKNAEWYKACCRPPRWLTTRVPSPIEANKTRIGRVSLGYSAVSPLPKTGTHVDQLSSKDLRSGFNPFENESSGKSTGSTIGRIAPAVARSRVTSRDEVRLGVRPVLPLAARASPGSHRSIGRRPCTTSRHCRDPGLDSRGTRIRGRFNAIST